MSSISKPTYTLFHAPGCGSTFALALLCALQRPSTDGAAHVAFDIDVCTLDADAVARRDAATPHYSELARANALLQLPTLVTPEGAVLTETGAIALCKSFLLRSDSSISGTAIADGFFRSA